jgi:hypothetical protein
MAWWAFITKGLMKDAVKKKEQWSFANIKQTVAFRESYIAIYYKVLEDAKLTGMRIHYELSFVRC